MAHWYYEDGGQQQGPVGDVMLSELISRGQVKPETMVWREGMQNWQPMSRLPEFQSGNITLQNQPSYSFVPNSNLAIASMVCGIVSLLLCYVHGLAALPAVICGHKALRQIRNSSVLMSGRGMAIAGLVTGYLGLAIQLGFIIIFCFVGYAAYKASYP
jgi:GYF domain 2/Domain of unknown function (DUF4190)